MPLLALAVLFVVVPLVELYLIVEVVGEAIGAIPTILLLAADSLIGAWLLRTQGRAVWARFNEALAVGRMPHREVQEGILVIFGGAFLITPGFLTDIAGLLMLLPPSRAVIRRLLMRWIGRKMQMRVASAGTPGPWDVEGTAAEYEEPSRPLER